MSDSTAVLLLPRTHEHFLLRDQAEDLLRASGVVALEPAGIPYGVLGRLPTALARRFASLKAARLQLPPDPRVFVIFHPFQLSLAEALLRRYPRAELWYGRWDRYEYAYDAGPRMRARLQQLHDRAACRAALTFVASERLAEIEHESGRTAALVPLAADSFPAPDPGESVIAVSLGHLGWRNDWALLRSVAEAMPELIVLLIGEWHECECEDDHDFKICRELPNLVWLGAQPNEAAACLIACADVGIVPFKVEPFNDAGLPFRILKYARLGRRTVAPPLAGAQTWSRAVTFASSTEEWIAALRDTRGTRLNPDQDLRQWALSQTATEQNAPLWERLRELGIS